MLNLFANFLSHLHLTGDQSEEPVMKLIRAIEDREADAVRVITERLKVKEMGPADHIRTKHEAKAFVESGDLTAADALLKSAQARRELNQSQSITQKETQQRGERMGQ